METSGLSDRLNHYGIHVDDLSRLRVLDENSGAHSHDLRDNCREFVGDVSNLTDIADGFIEVIDAVANEVNKEKVKVIGARNRLQTIAKERETQVWLPILPENSTLFFINIDIFSVSMHQMNTILCIHFFYIISDDPTNCFD